MVLVCESGIATDSSQQWFAGTGKITYDYNAKKLGGLGVTAHRGRKKRKRKPGCPP
jgi:hypothetical protein